MTNDDNSPVVGGEPVLPPSKFGVGYTSGESAVGGPTTPPRIASSNPPAAPAVPPSYLPSAGDDSVVPAAVPPPYVPNPGPSAAPAGAPDYPAYSPAPDAPPSGNFPPPPAAYPPPATYSPPGGMVGQPDNYLVWAILSTLFCCLPLGIVSIVKSTQVAGLWAQGQYAAAQQAANDAKKWAKWSAIASVALLAAYVLIYILGALVVAVVGM